MNCLQQREAKKSQQKIKSAIINQFKTRFASQEGCVAGGSGRASYIKSSYTKVKC